MGQKTKRNVSCATLCLLTLFICGVVYTATAQQRPQYASTEDIALAFYKTGDVMPNFKNWVTERQPYNETPLARRETVMNEELLRLTTAYNAFSPVTDIITIKTSGYFNPKEEIGEDGLPAYALDIKLDQNQEVLYLPYDFMDQIIMVMPMNLNVLKDNTITEFDYTRLKKLSDLDESMPLIMTLRPVRSNFNAPQTLDDILHWAFIVEIVAIESWDNKGNLLWQYSADNYMTPHQQQILNLYELRPTDSNKRGDVKIFMEQ